MVDDATLTYLKQAINKLSKEINKQNNISVITSLLNVKVITLEEALNDKDFREIYDRLHTKTCEEPGKCKQIIRAQKG